MELCSQNYVKKKQTKKQPSHLVHGTAKFLHKGNHYSCYQFKIKWGHLGASVGVCAWVCMCVDTQHPSTQTHHLSPRPPLSKHPYKPRGLLSESCVSAWSVAERVVAIASHFRMQLHRVQWGLQGLPVKRSLVLGYDTHKKRFFTVAQ